MNAWTARSIGSSDQAAAASAASAGSGDIASAGWFGRSTARPGRFLPTVAVISVTPDTHPTGAPISFGLRFELAQGGHDGIMTESGTDLSAQALGRMN